MRLFAPAVLLLLVPLAASAQPKPKEKPHPLDKIDGYTRHTVEGFTLMVSDETTKADVSKFERKPLEVLELELKMITGIMTQKQADALRKLPVWVEWEEEMKMNNGRGGAAEAVYYGGDQLTLLKEGKQPLKAQTVTVLRMKSLTAEHQPKGDSGRCVLLHEFAHAVHWQVLGHDNAGVKAAYAQAMERKLYDKEQYVSTNPAEFFAELTCAYFDQLHHYPNTRDDLKKHDPATFKMLDAIWGTGKKPKAVAKAAGPLANTGAGKFDLGVTPADLMFGEAAGGAKVTADDLKGKVAVVAFFAPGDYPVLDKLAAAGRELGEYGLYAAAGSVTVTTADDLKAVADGRGLTFPVMDKLFLREKDDPTRFGPQKQSHALVFDPDGKCVFRGSGHDALPHARAAVGRALLAEHAPGEPSKPLAPVADALVGGLPLLDVLPRLAPLISAKDEETSKPAKDLLAALTAPGQKVLDDAKKLTKADPLGAFLLLEGQAAKYKGSPLADRLANAVDGVRLTPAVQAEVRARAAFEPVKKLEAALAALPGGFDPTSSDFRTKNAVGIGQLKAAVDAMKKKHPAAKATEQAEKLLAKYGK